MDSKGILEAARIEFRRFGFRCDGGVLSKQQDDYRLYSFDTEAATGMAAFSQYTVTPYVRIWDSSGRSGDVLIELGVSYTHFQSGSNGWSATYSASRNFADESASIRRI